MRRHLWNHENKYQYATELTKVKNIKKRYKIRETTKIYCCVYIQLLTIQFYSYYHGSNQILQYQKRYKKGTGFSKLKLGTSVSENIHYWTACTLRYLVIPFCNCSHSKDGSSFGTTHGSHCCSQNGACFWEDTLYGLCIGRPSGSAKGDLIREDRTSIFY